MPPARPVQEPHHRCPVVAIRPRIASADTLWLPQRGGQLCALTVLLRETYVAYHFCFVDPIVHAHAHAQSRTVACCATRSVQKIFRLAISQYRVGTSIRHCSRMLSVIKQVSLGRACRASPTPHCSPSSSPLHLPLFLNTLVILGGALHCGLVWSSTRGAPVRADTPAAIIAKPSRLALPTLPRYASPPSPLCFLQWLLRHPPIVHGKALFGSRTLGTRLRASLVLWTPLHS